MGAKTNIEWADSTFNPWWGCTEIGPGCDNCYAKAVDKRTGGNHWGREERRILSNNNWKEPLKWQRQSTVFFSEHGRRRRVFCASMSDVFDTAGPDTERQRLWQVIDTTPDLNWLILTKRPRNISRYLPEHFLGRDNIWLGTTVEDRTHGLPRLDALKSHPAVIRFLSIEPLLGDLGTLDLHGIDWVIVGGESGPNARPMQKEWVLNIQRQCADQGVTFFFKQWGAIIGKGGCLLDGKEYKAWPRIA